MSRLLSLLLSVLLSAPLARAEAPSAAPEARLSVAVLPFEADGEARDDAPGLTALLVSRLAESPRLVVSSPAELEALRAAGVCAGDECPGVAASSGQARYIVSGRLHRFGSRYLLTATLLDSESGLALARPRLEVSAPDALPRATVSLADALLAQLVPNPVLRAFSPRPSTARGFDVGSLVVGLRVNNSLVSRLASFNPGGDLEFGIHFHPEWVAFAQVGFSYVRSEEEGRKGGLTVLPSVLGLRHYHLLEHSLRPYWGFGLGVQLSFGEYGIFQQTGPLPTVTGFAGVEYLIAGHLGIQLEVGTNLAQATLGLAGNKLGSGLNLDLNAGIAWHF